MSQEPSADLESTHERYRAEREKRLNALGNGQYVSIEDERVRQLDIDHWKTDEIDRAPICRDVEVLLVGGGLSGLQSGASLRRHGLPKEELCIIERGGDFGGTWYWNRYPGLHCDTEAYIYLPLLEETGYIPIQKYASGPEIFAHCQRIARHFELYDSALLQTILTAATWDEERSRWIVETDRGDRIAARFLWQCGGATSKPKIPNLPGLDDFQGHSFHTMRWDYGYTGGGPDGGMTNLREKRVGVIGTGCTSIQCVPHLADWAEHLTVFQRTPSAVNIRANRPTDPAWAGMLTPGWQKRRMENFLNILSGVPEQQDLVDDAWTWNFRDVRYYADDQSLAMSSDEIEQVDFRIMSQVRARVDELVGDPETADALKPWYGMLCKRPAFHDGYLQTFNRDNVSLVSFKEHGIERVVAEGIIADGETYPLDCIVFATGFDVSGNREGGRGFNPVGVGGMPLSARLRSRFATLHGIHVHGFPNLFIIGGLQSTLATTRTYDLLVQSDHCARLVQSYRRRGIIRAEVTEAAEARWQKAMADHRLQHSAYFQECTPGYYNGEGKGEPVWSHYFGGGPVQYARIIENWLANDVAADMALTSQPAGAPAG